MRRKKRKKKNRGRGMNYNSVFFYFFFCFFFFSIYRYGLLFFFFFQAEDGIRDLTVTGVQRVLFRSLLKARRTAGSGAPAWKISIRFPAKIGRASCRGKSGDLGGRRTVKKKIAV